MTNVRILTESEIETVRHMARKGEGVEAIRRKLHCSTNTTKRLLKAHEIELDPPKMGPKKRNPMNHLQEWSPPKPNTNLEHEVQRLRAKYRPVCSEETIRYPHRVPMGYTRHTLFRVGNMQNVTAAELATL